MALTKISGSILKDPLNLGEVSIGGTLTYQDVTNVDSVGVITARSDISIADKIIHNGDTNTAIRFPAADTFTAETSGNERFRIDSNGRIGIGIANPDAYFASYNRVVMGRTNDSGSMTIVSAPTYGGYIAFADGTSGNAAYRGLITYAHGQDAMVFNTAATERLRILNNGNVGIATTDATEKLTILGNVSVKQFAGTDAKIEINETTTTNPLRLSQTATEARIQTNASQPLNIRAQGGSGSSSHLAFWTRESERFRIDASGRFLLGHTTTQTIGSNSHGLAQINIDQNQPALTLSRFENVSAGPSLVLGKSRSNTIGNYTVVQSGDGLGNVAFAGADGNDLVTVGANIEAQVDGTPGSNDMPTRLVFATTRDGDSSPTESLRIHSGGEVTKLHNPRFQVYKSGSHFQLSGGSGTITYNSEVYDTGSNYNTSTGRFTAPVSGAYYFHHCLQIRSALSGTGIIEAKVWVILNGSSGSGTERIRDYTMVEDTNVASHAFGLLGLNAGDQVYPAYYNGISGNAYAQNNGGNTPLTSFFEGYLIQ